ncbi:uncharacterized protein N7469_007089 [Penicillium citrinum]|uniref:CENP-V/GFA domain-containing protein n=2 Tax=Penicillium TaxID=5073 RepID=A0A9W9NVZ5_PENCI|nr:uncharacterized protein N7469_007089 [Penicillium citrinum]KAJ5227083.1 hypothetical protein N7469_007089 [Penicillium citrinum]KAJ5568456.1 hypothetical protein N7450_010942 [Penicillium hetheringtonii]
MTFPPTPTSESSSHTGQCHCGGVRFKFTISPPLHQYPVNSCNCTICTKNGYLLVYPFQKDFTLEQGQDKLKEYQFGPKNVWHQFCGECGSSCFIRLPEKSALLPDGSNSITVVNTRLLDDFDYEKLQINKVDGRSF